MAATETSPGKQPVAVLGAGNLVSHLHRENGADDASNYRFSVFRLTPELQATHELRPCDLPDLVKLCQVLAFAIADDGWIPSDSTDALRELFDDLDELTQRWSHPEND